MNLLPKLDFAETVNTLLSYLVIVGLSLTVVIVGMRIERHIIAEKCHDGATVVLEGQPYQCRLLDSIGS